MVMFIIYRGFGWTVPLFYLAAMLATASAYKYFGRHLLTFGGHDWGVQAALALPGSLLLSWGLRTNWRAPFEAVDLRTGMARRLRIRHSLYFIPIEYWGAAGLAGAIALLFVARS